MVSYFKDVIVASNKRLENNEQIVLFIKKR